MLRVTCAQSGPLPVCAARRPRGRGPAAAGAGKREKQMSRPKQVRLAGSVLDRSRHVCAFFHRKEEEYRVLLPFIKEGFEQSDRAFHIVDSRHRPEHLQRLHEVGIDMAEAERKGQLEVRCWEDAYLQ